ncbi:extracellular solute-binding protein [Oceanispirochaeta crateris]|uniref:Extracellular solute-binding protein n=1 Tax=Oceanispirochaeta crateris TaxID=2518645 RepID=A0A5C1QSE5_9SPIO|nr:extracellular solute-binding protein [Oceanispirochaeta crateris]QEN09564.1 extracellular solute-binding protein [Oceanispirochaeta crateris]
MNKSQTKFVLMALALCLVLSSVVFAAGSKESENDGIVLSTYLQIDPANPQQQGYVEMQAAFEASRPDITFKHEYATGEAFHQKFQAMVASRELPDVFTTYIGKRTAYVTETGNALDLNTYLTDDFKKQFSDATWESQGPNGEIYTIAPSMAVCHAMYVNTDLLKEIGLEIPTTYEELLDQVQPIRDAGYYPISMGNKDQWVVNSWLLSAFVDRMGGKTWFNKAMTGSASFTDAPFVKSLEIINEMVQKNVFSPGVNQMSNTEADQEFYQQKSVYLIDAGWRTSAMVTTLPQEQQDAIEMIVFPALPGEVQSNSSAAVLSEGFGINAKLGGTPEGQAAFDFIAYYTGEEGASIRLKNGEIPTYKLDYSGLDLPGLQLKYAEFQQNHPMGYVIDAKMDGEGMGILNPDIQAMMFGNLTPDEVASRYEAWVKDNDSNRDK